MTFPNIPALPKTDDPRMDFLNESVTRGDVTSKVSNNVIHVMIPLGDVGAGWGNYGIDQLPLPPTPPAYWTIERDMILRATAHKETYWAGALGIAISKIAAMGFEIKGDVPLRIKRGQEIMLYADGRQVGYINFISKHLRDYLTTDNGAFFEVVRETSSYMSQVIGIRHLDSARCIRTGDPLVPVVYRDRRNYYHELKYHEVIGISDMPDSGETYNGIGLCAASRAYYSIYKMAAIEWYLREKVGGLQPLAIHIVNGILNDQLAGAVQAAKEGAISRGVMAHMGAVMIGIPADQAPGLVTIPLAELPDGFNRKEEFDLSILAYANSIGLDPQDLQPLTGAPLGSGMQTEILHEKSKGRGLAGWRPQFTHQVNEFVLSQGTTFTFYDKDFRDLQAQANLSKALVETSAARIQAGITTAQEERNLLVDKDELPKEFLSEDVTAGETLSDSEKPEDGEPEKDGKQAGQAPGNQQAQAPGKPQAGQTPGDQAPPKPGAPKQAGQPGEKEKQAKKEFTLEDFEAEIGGAQDIYEMLDAGIATLKHLAEQHDQKRHAWRYGSNVPLSRLKRQRESGGDSEWEEYKSRARARRGVVRPKKTEGGGGKGEPEKKQTRGEVVAARLKELSKKHEAEIASKQKEKDEAYAKLDVIRNERQAIYKEKWNTPLNDPRYDELQEKYDEKQAEYAKNYEDYTKKREAYDNAMENAAKDYRRALAVDNPAQLNHTYERIGKDRKKEFDEALTDSANMINASIFHDGKIPPVLVSGKKGARANYSPTEQKINIKEGGKRVVAHEFGHHIEVAAPDIGVKMVEFWDKRTRGESFVSLRSLFPNHGYGIGESTKQDKWIHAYMGKVYPTPRIKAGAMTELLSMGLEYLYAQPMTLLEQDPEYFYFLIDVLQGQ